MVKYICVEWPEYQFFMDHQRFRDECYYCPDANVYFVPEDLYDEVMNKLEFPKKYEDTNLGTIVCYETRAIVNGDDIYWYDEDLIKRGSEVLIYNHNIENYPKWIISKCVACSEGFPILFEDSNLLPDINCEIIGVRNDG